MQWLQEEAPVKDESRCPNLPDAIRRELEQLSVEPSWASGSLTTWVDEIASRMNLHAWERAVRESKHLAGTLIPLLTAAIHHKTTTRYLVPVVLYASIPAEKKIAIKLPAIKQVSLGKSKLVGFHRLSSLTYEQNLSELSDGLEAISTDRYERLVLELTAEDGEPTWSPTSWFLELEQNVSERKGKLLVVVCKPEWWLTALVQCMRHSISAKEKAQWRFLTNLQQPGAGGFSLALDDVIARYAIGGAVDSRGFRHPDKSIQSALVEFNYSWSTITNTLRLS